MAKQTVNIFLSAETKEIAYMHLGDRASVILILRTTKKSVHVEQG